MSATTRNILIILLIAAPLAGAASADEPLPPGRDHQFEGREAERATRIQKEFQDAGRELAETHAEALRREELQAPLQKLSDAMKAEMIRIAPEQKNEIEHRYAVHREIVLMEKAVTQPTEQDRAKFSELVLQYNNLTESLDDLPKRAANAPALKEEREKFHKELLAVMTRINPKVPSLMEQQQKSISEYHEFSAELMSRHGAAAPAAQRDDATATPTPAR